MSREQLEFQMSGVHGMLVYEVPQLARKAGERRAIHVKVADFSSCNFDTTLLAPLGLIVGVKDRLMDRTVTPNK